MSYLPPINVFIEDILSVNDVYHLLYLYRKTTPKLVHREVVKRLLPSSTQLYTVINNIIRYPLCRWLAYRCNYRGYLPLPRMIRSFSRIATATQQTIGFDLGCVLNTLWSTARQIIHSTTIKRDTEDVWLVSCYWITSQRYKFIHMIWLFNSSIEKCKACKANENNNIDSTPATTSHSINIIRWYNNDMAGRYWRYNSGIESYANTHIIYVMWKIRYEFLVLIHTTINQPVQ